MSALIILSVDFAFCAVFRTCLEYVSLGSNVRPRIFGSLIVGKVVLSICKLSFVLYCAGSGVNKVVVVLVALSDCWLSMVHW